MSVRSEINYVCTLYICLCNNIVLLKFIRIVKQSTNFKPGELSTANCMKVCCQKGTKGAHVHRITLKKSSNKTSVTDSKVYM